MMMFERLRIKSQKQTRVSWKTKSMY